MRESLSGMNVMALFARSMPGVKSEVLNKRFDQKTEMGLRFIQKFALNFVSNSYRKR